VRWVAKSRAESSRCSAKLAFRLHDPHPSINGEFVNQSAFIAPLVLSGCPLVYSAHCRRTTDVPAPDMLRCPNPLIGFCYAVFDSIN